MPNKIIPFEKSFASSSQIILNYWNLVKNNMELLQKTFKYLSNTNKN